MKIHVKHFITLIAIMLYNVEAADSLGDNKPTSNPSRSAHVLWTTLDVVEPISEYISQKDINSYVRSCRNTLLSTNNSLRSRLNTHSDLHRLFERSQLYTDRTFVITPDMLIIRLFNEILQSKRVSDNKNFITTTNQFITAIKLNNFCYTFLPFEELPRKTLLKKAYAGNIEAQRLVAEGYAYGGYGFRKNIDELSKFAELGWKEATYLHVNIMLSTIVGQDWLTQSPSRLFIWTPGCILTKPQTLDFQLKQAREVMDRQIYNNIFKWDPIKVLRFAARGCIHAQTLILKGYTEGRFEFEKNPKLARFFEIYFKYLNEDLKKTKSNIKTFKELPFYTLDDLPTCTDQNNDAATLKGL